MTTFHAIILAIIEGITEFLPVSSTGHMILASAVMKIQDAEFAKTFEIVIQLGAIMAVAVLYIKRFFVSINIYLKLIAAFIPTGIIGVLAYKTIKAYLFNPFVVSIALIVGGVILILLDKWTEEKKSSFEKPEDISYSGAVKIGLFQCLSMIPGVSRAAASIFGGIFAGFDRKLATEFSFLLAIPTMLAASGKDLWESKDMIHSDNIKLLLIGGIVAFIFAVIAVKGFISFVQKYGFKHFGYYRIILGILFLSLSLYLGINLSA
ncbi:MAG: undecaprenyl-diphosphate phosphatase [Bacteroidetes bacterium]|nr:undecaprenyl-diphosphate phosphatase [Bacteroidota bacterium]